MSDLKLRAFDAEDLLVVAAHLQDAATRVGDMTFQPKERRFVMLLERVDWAAATPPGGDKAGEVRPDAARTAAALRIEQVTKAQVQGIDLKAKDEAIALLTVLFEPPVDPALAPSGQLIFLCEGGAAIRLQVECIEVQLEDLGEA